MKILHDEARELAVEAYEKSGNAQQVADIFGINKYTLYHWAEQKKKTGSVALRYHNCGRKKAVSEEERKKIREAIDAQPDITLMELKEKLHLAGSISAIDRAVLSMGYVMKKKSLHAKERERPRCAGETGTMERNDHT